MDMYRVSIIVGMRVWNTLRTHAAVRLALPASVLSICEECDDIDENSIGYPAQLFEGQH